ATGRIEVLDYVGVEDVGRIINPETLHGQAYGAIVQGLSGVLQENLVYDEEAQLLAGSFADYAMPLAGDFPHIHVVALDDRPTSSRAPWRSSSASRSASPWSWRTARPRAG